MFEQRRLSPFSNPLGFIAESKEQKERGLAERYINAYRGWHALEKRLQGNSFNLIDLQLLDLNSRPQEFENRAQVRKTLESFLEHIAKLSAKPEDQTFLRARTIASIYYLDALEGKTFRFEDYVAKTLGVSESEIFEIPQKEIDIAYQIILANFKEVSGYDGYNKRTLRRFRNRGVVSSPLEVEQIIREAGQYFSGEVGKFLGFEELLVEPRCSFRFRDEPESTWINWFSRDEEGFFMNINIGRLKEFSRGRMTNLGMHELAAHWGSYSIRRSRIRMGDLNPALGVYVIPGPEYVLDEGIAGALHHYVPGLMFSLEAQFTDLERELKLMIWHNAYLRLAHAEDLEEEAKRQAHYILEYLPGEGFIKNETWQEQVIKVEGQLLRSFRNPMWKSYRLAYSIGQRKLKQFAAPKEKILLETVPKSITLPQPVGLSEAQKRKILLEIFQRPMTLLQFETLAKNIVFN